MKIKQKVLALNITWLLVVIDLLSKSYIASNISVSQRIPVIDGFFWLTNYRNTGAAWSFLENQTSLLTLISLVAFVGILIHYLKKDISNVEILAFVLILAGTLGNLYDRFFFGYVRDFLSFNIFGYMFPVFNVADSCLVIGVAILMLDVLLLNKENKNA